MIMTCKFCKEDFSRKNNQIYCSLVCSRKQYKLTHYRKTFVSQNSCVSIGAFNELLVCWDLLRKGYSVFRSVSPAAPCDLIILTKSEIFRIEVKTSRKLQTTGKIYYNKQDLRKCDILAVVVNKIIKYIPKLSNISL